MERASLCLHWLGIANVQYTSSQMAGHWSHLCVTDGYNPPPSHLPYQNLSSSTVIVLAKPLDLGKGFANAPTLLGDFHLRVWLQPDIVCIHPLPDLELHNEEHAFH